MKVLIQNQQRRRPLNKPLISDTASKILTFLGQPEAELSILFIGNKKMKELNSSYRGKNSTTDVLSFESGIPVSHDGTDHVLGDIVICIAKAEEQAEEYGTSFDEEICRLLIHGTLHLIGYDHEISDYQHRKMTKKEEETINALKKVDPQR